jgi:hypothetical protein
MEDELGEMRPSLETACLELLNPDEPGVGELLVATLTNPFMPLLNYRIGDLAERLENPFGTRYVVHGRVADTFVTQAGRRTTTWQIDQCFDGLEGFAHYQLLQRPGNEWLLRFVPDQAGPEPKSLQLLRRRLAGLLAAGERLAVEQTDLLVPERSGKFRLGYPLASQSPSRQDGGSATSTRSDGGLR